MEEILLATRGSAIMKATSLVGRTSKVAYGFPSWRVNCLIFRQGNKFVKYQRHSWLHAELSTGLTTISGYNYSAMVSSLVSLYR